MSRITTTRIIDAPIDLVFKTVADIRNFSEAIPNITNIEFLSDIKSGVGTKFRETREINGKEGLTELEVTEYEENDHIRIVADSHGTVWDSVFTVEKTDDGTILKLIMHANAYKLLPKLMNPIMKFFMKKELDKDMDAVKNYCENI